MTPKPPAITPDARQGQPLRQLQLSRPAVKPKRLQGLGLGHDRPPSRSARGLELPGAARSTPAWLRVTAGGPTWRGRRAFSTEGAWSIDHELPLLGEDQAPLLA